MAGFENHLSSVLTFMPLALAVVGLLIPAPRDQKSRLVQGWALLSSLATLGYSLWLYAKYKNGVGAGSAEFQFVETLSWIPGLGINYSLGVDGISIFLIMLTTFLMPIAILSSFNSVEERVKEYYFLILALESAMLGAFVALDLFLFYVFWEAMLIPMYFMIGIWGGKDRVYAAMKFFLYTLVGSLLMLVAIFYLAHAHKMEFGTYSTLLTDLYKVHVAGGGPWAPQCILFMAFALAFAVKVPLFPLHTWLPDAHVQAPTAGSVILAAVLLKMGGYGFMRIGFPLFPEAVAYFQVPFMVLGVVAIVYGAWVAMVQPDIKKLVAYSSVSHMGYVIIGLFSLNDVAVTGALYQMLNHGVSTGALFLLVGMVYERRHTREISAFGGLSKVMPMFAVVFMIVTLSSVALPGTNGFVGEFLILLGVWKFSPVLSAVATLGVIFGAVYMLWMFQRVMFGPIVHKENEHLEDLTSREWIVLAPLVVAVFAMGIFPSMILKVMEPSVQKMITQTTRSMAQSQSEEVGVAYAQKDKE